MAIAPATVHDLAAARHELRVTCGSCRHRARIGAADAVAIVQQRRRPPAIGGLTPLLRCSMCGARQPQVEARPIASDRERALERREARD